MSAGVPIARILGIEVRLSLAWAFLVALVTLIGAEQATISAPGLASPLHWLVGLVIALAFLATAIAHELAHAVVSRRRGVPVTAILVDFLGGVAPLTIQAKRPRDELAIALSGPLLSLAVAAISLPIAVGLAFDDSSLGLLGGALLVVGGLNLVLAVMSLLPGMPLDGGRVVRALAWAGTGDRDRASRLTVRIGRVLGWSLAGAGLVFVLVDLVVAGMLALGVGWLLATSAKTLAGRLEIERLLRGATVADATRTDVPRVPPGLTVDTFADRYRGEDAVSSLPVVDGDRVVGVIGIRRVRRVSRAKQATTRAADILQAPPEAPFLAPGDDLWTSVAMMDRIGVDGLAVVADGALQGMVVRQSIAGLLASRVARPGGRGEPRDGAR